MNNPRYCLLLLFGLLINHESKSQNHALKPIWKTDTIMPVPESVLYDAKSNLLYVSLMDGASAEKDGKGEIGKLQPDGKVIDLNWITGLNAPKGMAIYNDELYVADLNEILVISIQQKKVVRKITVDSSVVLNDVTVSDKGIVYVSDPRTGKIFRLEDGTVNIYLSGLTRPNGLKAIKNDLYVLANGALYCFNKKRKQKLIVQGMDENTDGLEPVKKGEYIVSCWNGIIYYVSRDGKVEPLLDNRKEEYYTADIGYNMEKHILYVPSLFRKTVAAYKLQ